MKAWTDTMPALLCTVTEVSFSVTRRRDEPLVIQISGAGRTCAEVRAHAEGELRAWQADGEDEEA